MFNRFRIVVEIFIIQSRVPWKISKISWKSLNWSSHDFMRSP
jgi:hypothetical protein